MVSLFSFYSWKIFLSTYLVFFFNTLVVIIQLMSFPLLLSEQMVSLFQFFFQTMISYWRICKFCHLLLVISSSIQDLDFSGNSKDFDIISKFDHTFSYLHIAENFDQYRKTLVTLSSLSTSILRRKKRNTKYTQKDIQDLIMKSLHWMFEWRSKKKRCLWLPLPADSHYPVFW